MLPVRLELKNFLPFRSPDPLRFDGVHLACLTGPNGSGKSSLLDAMTWALWGEARAKRHEELIHLGQSDMSVQLDFEQDGIIYRVLRRRSHGTRGIGTLNLLAHNNGQWHDLTEPSMKATQDRINRILRLTFEVFSHSAFIQQGRADAFTTKQPAQRKQILSDILGLAQWERFEEAVKEMLKGISGELEVIDMRITEIDHELAKEPALKIALAEAEQAQQEAQAALDAAEVSLAEVAHATTDMLNAKERLAEAERRLKERERDLETIAVEIERHQQRIAAYEAVIVQREEIQAGYAALQSAREADSALGDKLLQLSDFDAQRGDLQRQLDAARAELEIEASGYEARMSELELTLGHDYSGDLSIVQAEVIALQELQQQRDSFLDHANGLNEERAQLEATNKALYEEMLTLRKRIDQLQETLEPLCPLCGQPLDEQHRRQLVEELGEDGTQRGNTFRANQVRLEEVGVELANERHRIGEIELELKRLPPLMQRAGELQAQTETAQDAASRLDGERAHLEAVRAILEAETFAQELREQLAALDSQRAEIGYDRETHSAARQQLDNFRDYEARQTELEVALNGLPDAQTALEAACNRETRTRTALAEDQESIAALNTEIAHLEVLVHEQQIRQQEVNRVRTLERQAYQRLVNARQELDALDKQRIRKEELETRREQKRHEDALYKELRLAFSKNGIPAMIIEAAIPELETAANRLLARMTDGRMQLTLTTQREKVTGGVAETLEIQIADELGTRNYETYSGGEAFRINFALRVALSQMLARRAGAQLRTLFIDEGFGTQDEDGRNKLIEAITAIQDDFALILVITHIDDLRDSFPVHIVVDKTANGSRMSMR